MRETHRKEKAMKKGIAGFLIGLVCAAACFGDAWPHKNASGATVRHFIVLNHLAKKINVIMSGQKNFTMQPGDSLMFEEANNWSAARIAAYYDGITSAYINNLTLAEWTLNGWENKDFYDISLVDGYTVPVRMYPVQGTFTAPTGLYQCDTAGCTKDLLPTCPDTMQVKDASGNVIACMSACAKWFSNDSFCCRGKFGPTVCKPTDWSRIFKDACPWAYSYAYDDVTSTFTCPVDTKTGIGPDWVIEYGFFQDKLAAIRPGITTAHLTFNKVLKTNTLWYSIKGICGSSPILELYSSTGKRVMETGIANSTWTVPLHGLSKGVYFVVLKSGHSLLAQRAVVVK
jgi:hypothetical protein